jgi:hypothetical protein
LRQIQLDYDKTAAALEIDRQTRQDNVGSLSKKPEKVPKFTLMERYPVIKALYSTGTGSLSIQARIHAVKALVALCYRRELSAPRGPRAHKPDRPPTRFQCMFCLGDRTLSRQDQEHCYITKHSW